VPTVFRDFSAGQHVTLKVNIGGEIHYRTFSLSSIPNVDNNASITIKRIKGGKVTNYLFANLKVGDMIEVSAPSGQFYLNPEPANQKHYVMIAGGSGITPIYSMIGTILKFEQNSNITLLYANRTSESIIFNDKLNLWLQEFPNVFTIKHYLSEEEKPKDAIKGYITRIALEAIINKKNKENMEFYLCGPEIMTNKLIDDLVYLGIDISKIHRELFLINSQKQNITSEKAKVNAKIFGEDYEFETAAEHTILQSALMQNIPLPYSCQSGLCGMCKMKCTDGKVVMKNNQVLDELEVRQGYILTCQSLPQSNKIKLVHKNN